MDRQNSWINSQDYQVNESRAADIFKVPVGSVMGTISQTLSLENWHFKKLSFQSLKSED